jgi:hypothetical protein
MAWGVVNHNGDEAICSLGYCTPIKDCHGAGSIYLPFEIDYAPRKDVNQEIA